MMNDAALIVALDDLAMQADALKADALRLRRAIEDRMNPKVALVVALAEAVDPPGFFTTADVSLPAKLTKFPRLAAAIDGACNGSARGLGRALSSLEDQEIAGFIVRRDGTDRGHTLWQVTVAPVR